MSYPAVFTEQWPAPGVSATVALAQQGFPPVLPGQAEMWAMGGGYAAFPPADAVGGLYPPTTFRIFDPADPREIMRVRQTGPTWAVVRGDQGSLPVPHAAGFTVLPFTTASALAAMAPGVPSGNGLLIPGASRDLAGVSGGWSWYFIAPHEFEAPAGELNRGAVYEVMGWGHYTFTAAGSPNIPALMPTPPYFCAAMYFGGYTGNPDKYGDVNRIGQIAIPLGPRTIANLPAHGRWRIHGTMAFYPGAVTTTIELHLATGNGGAANNAGLPVELRMFGPDNVFTGGRVDTNGGPHGIGLLLLPETSNSVFSYWFQGGRAWRSA